MQFILVLVILAVVIAIKWAATLPSATWAWVAGIGCLAAVIYGWVRHTSEAATSAKMDDLRQRRDSLLCDLAAAGEACIALHLQTLRKKHAQLVRKNEYGLWEGYDKWEIEESYFVQKVLLSYPDYSLLLAECLKVEKEILKTAYAAVTEGELEQRLSIFRDEEVARFKEALFERVLSAWVADDALPESEISLMSGSEYEVFCADLLAQVGWDVVRKGGTGDQGVDLLAKMNGTIVAVQCKRYSSPVGNKAVQEVEAGRVFEQADLAAVVSNTDFTPAARQLAASLGVMLLHHSELPVFHSRALAQCQA